VLNPASLHQGLAPAQQRHLHWTTGYALAYTQATCCAQMGAADPGNREYDRRDVRLQVNLIAPVAPGTYQGFWNMRNARNQRFGETVWVASRAGAPPHAAPTQTPAPNINFTPIRPASPRSIGAFPVEVENVQAVFFFHEGQDWRNHGVAGVASRLNSRLAP